MSGFFKTAIEYYLGNRKWRKMNPHNETSLRNVRNMQCIEVGNKTYGLLDCIIIRDEARLKIGSFCSIASDVKWIVCGEHPINRISTFPFLSSLTGKDSDAVSHGDIVVDDDVWIGHGAIILSGVHIGQGAVVAAGAVVAEDVPPYAIVGGVPAKIIKYRFEPEMINELLKIDYSKLTEEIIKTHIDELYSDLKEVEQLEWLPHKFERED